MMWEQRPTGESLTAGNQKAPMPYNRISPGRISAYRACISAQLPNRMPDKQSKLGVLLEALPAFSNRRTISSILLMTRPEGWYLTYDCAKSGYLVGP